MNEVLLGVNIDHIATLRQVRGATYPDPVQAAAIAERAGADSITVHLREDRRHIQDRDVEILIRTLDTRMNFEMAITDEMLDIATGLRPSDVCLVPEKREELTTEGGLDVAGTVDQVAGACQRLRQAGIRVSLFIDPEESQLRAAATAGAPVVELHTGNYAGARDESACGRELERLRKAAELGDRLGLRVNAGHGLHYHNVLPVAAIPQIRELNIGHAIVARAVLTGLDESVRAMKALLLRARS